jgi:hypothetical protein
LLHAAMGMSSSGLPQFGRGRYPCIILILISKCSVLPKNVRMGETMRLWMLLPKTLVEISLTIVSDIIK